MWVLRPRDVQHPTVPVYHVPCRSVTSPVLQTAAAGHGELWTMRGPAAENSLLDPLFYLNVWKREETVLPANLYNAMQRVDVRFKRISDESAAATSQPRLALALRHA